jgi:uncharacterized protein
MFQDWEELTFLHWQYEPTILERLVPPGLRLDTFDGKGWMGLTPFRVTNLRPPGLSSIPWVSNFPESNVRTYVCGPDGAKGIWFFTLEVDRFLAVAGARAAYGLPYRWASMQVNSSPGRVEYTSRRHRPWEPARSRIRIRVGEPIATNALEIFLTARSGSTRRLPARSVCKR